MKKTLKIIALFTAFLLCVSAASAESVDVDLTTLSSTMVYAEVYNMMTAPEQYIGKTVKMQGQYAVFTNQDETMYYTAVVIADATACCQQGMEFVWDGAAFPDDYPEVGTEMTVTGVFETYLEDGVPYCHLVADSVEFQ